MTDSATATMAANLEAKTGTSLDGWITIVRGSGLQKHGQMVAFLKSDHGLTHGYANLVATTALAVPTTEEALVEAQYAGAKAGIRPIYEAAVAMATGLGADVEVAPKKTYVSLRRTKQFALIQAATRSHVEIGLNLVGEPGTDRLKETSGMCTHAVRVGSVDAVDGELQGWLAAAYQRA